MASSLQEQLLKAGLANEASLTKAKDNAKNSQPNKRSKGKQAHAKKSQNNQEPNLADLYRQRADLERKETQEAEKRKREQARIKKQNRKKIRDLVMAHIKNAEDANIRYNFIVGSNVKYVFVTEAQQTELSNGTLAITFIDGKRCIIPADLHDSIKAIDPNKLIVIATPSTSA